MKDQTPPSNSVTAARTGIIFSLRDGEVWASWPGDFAPVCLGSVGEVSLMMRDFLKQMEIGERLNNKAKYTN